MILTHKIKLYPSKNQELILKKSCDCARFAYNWGLSKWEEMYKNGIKPSAYTIDKEFNAIKKTEFPFMKEVSKCVSQIAFQHLNKAFKNYFNKKNNYPKFKKKKNNKSFGITNDHFKINDEFCILPKIGKVKMSQKLRYAGKIISGNVSFDGINWFISVGVDVNVNHLPKTNKFVGIDLGIKDLIITSDNEKIFNPKKLIKNEKKLKKIQHHLSKTQKDSKRHNKIYKKFLKLHKKITNQRTDYIHKATIYLIKKYDIICMEDLNVKGMLKNHKLAKVISDASFNEIKRQLQYKTEMYGKKLLFVNRYFPSTKLCNNCGCINNNISLNIREWDCPHCGIHNDRDINASKNILRQALSEFKHGENYNNIKSDDISFLINSMNREVIPINKIIKDR